MEQNHEEAQWARTGLRQRAQRPGVVTARFSNRGPSPHLSKLAPRTGTGKEAQVTLWRPCPYNQTRTTPKITPQTSSACDFGQEPLTEMSARHLLPCQTPLVVRASALLWPWFRRLGGVPSGTSPRADSAWAGRRRRKSVGCSPAGTRRGTSSTQHRGQKEMGQRARNAEFRCGHTGNWHILCFPHFGSDSHLKKSVLWGRPQDLRVGALENTGL